jgi:hypothetical protein
MNRNTAAASLVTILVSVSSHAASVFDGTWKADLEKNGRDAKPEVRQLMQGIYKCATCDPPYELKADGAQHPAPGSGIDTRSVSVLDAHSVAMRGMKDGKQSFESTIVVSKDDTTETISETIFDAGPEPFTVTEYFQRVAVGPAGSHAISGGWKLTKTEASDNVDVTTFKVIGDSLKRDDVEGSSYTAKLDGTPAPYTGDPRWDHVSVKLINASTIEETLTQSGQLRMKARWSVDADGVTMHAHFEDPKGSSFDQTGHKVK